MHCTGKDRSWVHGRAPHPPASTSTLGAATSRNPSWAHGRAPHPRASTSILCAEQVGIARGPHGITSNPGACTSTLGAATSRDRSWVHESTPSTSSHENPARCTGRNHPWVHGRAHHPRASTSILCTAHGPMGEHPIHEHHVRCTDRDPSWVHVRAPPKSIHEQPGSCNRRKSS